MDVNLLFPNTGRLHGSEKSHKGKLEIPNLSEEYDPSEIDVEVSANDENNDDAYQLKEHLRKKGTPIVREKMKQYIADLKQGW